MPPSEVWADPGWELAGPETTRLPTFMRAIPKGKPTYMPAGINAATPAARRRWREHAWRYPPYQYRTEYMMRSKKQPQSLRPVSATEREALMYLGRGATQFALNPVEIKRQPQLLEDTRCSLVGNSLNAGIVALLLAPPMVMRGLLKEAPTPQNIVDRMGLRPAEVAVVGQSYQLPRAVGPHRFDGLRRGYVHPSVQDAAKACDAQSSKSWSWLPCMH